ncbi:MAG TPA: hypothetical protein VMB53_14720 [Gaiellaceae bacterium]|nr:hypothetical protein [Gaiellaceae bacterium]
MPTRKQKRRAAKGQRHEHEFVWVDSEGQEVDAPPDAPAAPDAKSRNGGAPPTAQKAKQQPAQKGRAGRTVQPPSWQRAARRAAILGVVVFVMFSILERGHNPTWYSALGPALIYTALFIPFTYVIDRYAYNRYLAKTGQAPAASAAKKQPPKKS